MTDATSGSTEAAHPGDAHHDGQSHHARMVADFRRRFWVSLALTIPVLALAPLIQGALGLRAALAFPGDAYVQFGLATVVFLYGGWPFLTGALGELRERQPGMMTLIALAIGVAYIYSSAVVFGLPGEVFFWELATLVAIMLLGHWVEMRSVMGASRALEKLVRLMPDEAHRVNDDGSTEDAPVAELSKGDRVLVKPGEKVPVDGVVVEGRTSVNLAAVTGESQPVEVGEGDDVIGGTINGDSAVTVEVQKTGDASYLSQVVQMVQEAQASRSRTQDLADRAALWLTIVALGVGALTLTGWLVAGSPVVFAIARMVTVMVITCPHALGLAIPLVVSVSTSVGAQRGLLIRDRSAFERAREVDAVVFDKTGTLTEGRFGVADVVAFHELNEAEILRLAAGLESQSEHPIAAGIVRKAEEDDVQYPTPQGFSAIPGKGAQAQVDGRDVKVVSPGYLDEHGLSVDPARMTELSEGGKTVVYVLVEDALVGAIALADVVREDSREALAQLKDMGIQAMMLTGDSDEVARWVAQELDLDDYFAEVLPDEKSAKIKEVQSRGLTVAMVGDGVNDAPALTQADVGVAIGAGTDVAIESADIVLVRSNPQDVLNVVTLSRATYGKMVQNLGWATGYNVVAIPLAAGVLYQAGVVLSPAAGAVLMSLSTVIVAINARLLGRVRQELMTGAS